MSKHIVFMGSGAVGSYVGGRLAEAGYDVTLVGQWPEHIGEINQNGLKLSGTQGESTVRVNAILSHQVQQFVRKAVDVAIVSTKSYDTEWAATMIRQYLAPQGFVVSMQNSINEERIANIVGWGRTVGCILSGIAVDLFKPGSVRRYQQPGGKARVVFRVGEIHGRPTSRATNLVEMLNVVDSAQVTPNLWGERWTKLTTNSIMHAILGATGLESRAIFCEQGTANRLGIKIAAEAISVGWAQGYELSPVLGIPVDAWCDADAGDQSALKRVRDGLVAWAATVIEPNHSSVGRDVARGRRSEIEFTNGLVAAKGNEIGVPAPVNTALTAIVKRIDRGELQPDISHIEKLLQAA